MWMAPSRHWMTASGQAMAEKHTSQVQRPASRTGSSSRHSVLTLFWELESSAVVGLFYNYFCTRYEKQMSREEQA